MAGKTKNRLLIIVIALLIAATLYWLITADLSNDRTAVSAGTDYENAPEQPSEESIASSWHKKIDEAGTSAQFEALAHALINEAPAEGINKLMELLLDRWIEKDLAAALDFVSGIEARPMRETLLRYTLVEGGYLDFASVMNWISRQPESKSADLASLLYTEVGKDNPEHALRFIDLLTEEVKDNVFRTLLEQWAQQDITAAFAWMNTQTLPAALENMRMSLLIRMTEQNPQMAGALIRNMQAGYEKNTAARKYAEMLAVTDIQETVRWAGSLNDADAYGIAMTALYETWFRTEPDKKLIMEQVLAESDSALRDRLINEIALDMANANPAELAAILHRLPTTSQPDVAEKTVRFWKDRNAEQAMNWVSSLAPGPVRDRASKVMIESFLFKGDRQGALSLAATIGDNRLRYDSIRNVVEYWYQANPAEARQAIEGISTLSAAEKARLSAQMQKTQR
jgi:hypothetical protein